jgi:hypothetical protein
MEEESSNMSGIVLFHLIAIPLVFMLGRLSTRLAFVRIKAQHRRSVPDFLRERELSNERSSH